MNIGMLWFDNDKHSDLTTKIKKAVDYYHTKYGKAPNLCLVHPKTLGETPWKGMGIATSREDISKNCFNRP